MVDYSGMVMGYMTLNGTYAYDITLNTSPPQHSADERDDNVEVDVLMGVKGNTVYVSLFYIQDLKFFGLLTKE
ncbi:MAG TPA: hypothetical protein VN426_18220 [Syntrophomonadaceae bacterium]|nr:hypothetical protein [Syntrophomonadaceae bacterium]